MKNTKRTQNTTALKVQYIGATNCRSSRVKLTQLNNSKSVTTEFNQVYSSTLDMTEAILDKCHAVKSYSVIVDNTQNKHYLVSVETEGNSFPDLILEIKEALKN
jgi:hypothetical protein